VKPGTRFQNEKGGSSYRFRQVWSQDVVLKESGAESIVRLVGERSDRQTMNGSVSDKLGRVGVGSNSLVSLDRSFATTVVLVKLATQSKKRLVKSVAEAAKYKTVVIVILLEASLTLCSVPVIRTSSTLVVASYMLKWAPIAGLIWSTERWSGIYHSCMNYPIMKSLGIVFQAIIAPSPYYHLH